MWVLRNNPCCTPERADAAFEAQKQEQVNLAHVIPVLILYGTAIAKENGQVHFFEDTYGYDKALAKLFAQTTPQKTELPLDSPAAASFRYSACISYSALARDEEQP